MTRQINELANYFDPNDWRTNPDFDGSTINVTKIIHQAKRYLRVKYSGTARKIEEITGDTLYNSLKMMPVGNLVIMLGEETSSVASEVYNLFADSNKQEDGRYNYIDIENFVPRFIAVADKVAEIRSRGSVSKEVSEEDAPAPVTTGGLVLTMPDSKQVAVLDMLLKNNDLPPFKEIFDHVQASSGIVSKVATLEEQLKAEAEAHAEKVRLLSEKLAAKTYGDAKVEALGELPSGKVVMKSAASVFGISSLKFDVPSWEWDGVHPDVPEVDENYIFRDKEVTRALYALVTNQRAYTHGHTGTGKTTLWEQICAKLNWPFLVVNFDSDISRMDLIGRDTLSTDGEHTISKFVDGILPRAMEGPYVLCCDEIDFVRSDVAYVMQRALEGNGLRITEDGGRYVRPHPMFRMVATGNTVGQGDEFGMYQGARQQSLALLDRFTVWLKVDYLEDNQRRSLIKSHFPAVKEEYTDLIARYVTEHIAAFTGSKVLQPISPRGMLAVARTTEFLQNIGSKHAVRDALYAVVLDRASQQDYTVLKGIIDRVAK